MHELPPVAEMERAYRESDASYDGIFFLAVKTTGIFCRPSCQARKPFPANVEYFPTVREALFSGYRPCKRCRPVEAADAPPGWVRPVLDRLEQDPSVRWRDAQIRALGVDPARLRRYFIKRYGMTFQAYCRGRRLGRSLEAIREGRRLDDVILGHGYESHSGFREAFGRFFGRPPGKGAEARCVRVTWLESPLGPLVAGATEEGVCLLEFTDRRMLETQLETVRRRVGEPIVPGTNGHLERLGEELSGYFAGKVRKFGVPLVCPGSAFQRRVWEALLAIPYGETRSYGSLAEALGAAGAARAVGHANGLNRIGILIPCHRVVNASGDLGGYGGGLWRKRLLLDLEQGRPVPWREGAAEAAGQERAAETSP